MKNTHEVKFQHTCVFLTLVKYPPNLLHFVFDSNSSQNNLVPIDHICDDLLPVLHTCEFLYQCFTCDDWILKFHRCEDLVPIIHTCEDLVPIIHTCEDLVLTVHICENLVPIQYSHLRKIVSVLHTLKNIKCEIYNTIKYKLYLYIKCEIRAQILHPKNYRNRPDVIFTFAKSIVLVPILHMVWNLRSVKFVVQQLVERDTDKILHLMIRA